MIRVDCAGMVCFPAVLMVMGFGLHFCISSVKAIVIAIFRESIVPCAVSRIAKCFRRIAHPIIGYEVLFMMMKVSSNVYSPIWECIVYGLFRVQCWHIVSWEEVVVLFEMVEFDSLWIFVASFSLMTLKYAPESTRASILTLLNSRGMKSIGRFFLRLIADISGI